MGAFLDSEVVLRYVDGRRTLCRFISLRPRVTCFGVDDAVDEVGVLLRRGQVELVLDVSHIFDLSSVRVESPLSRVQRVTAALHGHHHCMWHTYFTEFIQRA